ncbi:MAG: tape measure protein, partial [Proteobacteria bacterium]|nr:tape measure protein [Pseudomonadota bacterium]
MILDELIGVLGWDLKGEGDLKRFQSGMQSVEKQFDAFAKKAQLFAVGLATALGAGAAAFGKSVIGVNAQFEGFEVALTTIEGSAEKARKSMDWVAKFARQTPYDVAGVTESFIKLKTYGIDPIADNALRTLGDAASAMNKPLDQAVEALADATTFQFERLREFGITVEQKGKQVTFSYQKNGKQVQETVQKSGEAVRKWVLDNLGDRFNGAMIRQSKSWNGMMSNLGDAWEDFQLRAGRNGGFFETVKGYLADLLTYIDELDKNGTLDHWSRQAGRALTFVVEHLKGNIEDIKFVIESFRGWLKANPDWWGPLKAGLVALGMYTFPKTFALLILEDILKWLQGKGSLIGDFAKSIEELTGINADSVDNVLAVLAAGGAGLLVAVGPTKALGVAIRALAKALALIGGGAAMKGLSIFGVIGGAVGNAARVLARHPLLTAAGVAYGALNDVPHEAMASATKNDPEMLARLARERELTQGVHFEGGRHRVGMGFGPASGQWIENYSANMQKMGAAAATVVNDNSDRSINVKATASVSVTQMNQAAAAAGRETEAAVRHA